MLYASPFAAILVEQNAHKVLPVTDRVAIIERGCVIHHGPSAALMENRGMIETHLGVTNGGRRVAAVARCA